MLALFPTLPMDQAERTGRGDMRVPDLQFRKLGENLGIVLLRAALVLAVVFALANSFPA